MNSWRSVRRLVVAAGVMTGLALAGDWADITPKRTGDYDANKGTGYCMIRVRVDIETIVHVRGDKVAFETMAGQQSSDEGTECSQPLPSGNGLANFRFRGVDGRGEQTLLEAPTAINSWTALIRIRDSRSGSEGYTSRIEWDNRGGSSVWDGAGWRGAAGSTNGNTNNSGWGNSSTNSGSSWGGSGWGGNGGNANGGNVNGGSEFNGTVTGAGRFETRNGVSVDLTEARVELMRNGQFRLEMRGNGAFYDLGGRWNRQGENVALEILQGLRNSGATGSGNLEFQGNQLSRVTVNGMDTRANSEFRAAFRAAGAANSGWGNSGTGSNSNYGNTAQSPVGWGNAANIRAFSGSSMGNGTMRVMNGRQMSLSEARVEIRADGEAMVELRGQASPTFAGRVENQSGNEVTIRVSRMAQSEADGTIRVQVSGGQVDRMEGQVRTRNGGDVSVSFRR